MTVSNEQLDDLSRKHADPKGASVTNVAFGILVLGIAGMTIYDALFPGKKGKRAERLSEAHVRRMEALAAEAEAKAALARIDATSRARLREAEIDKIVAEGNLANKNLTVRSAPPLEPLSPERVAEGRAIAKTIEDVVGVLSKDPQAVLDNLPETASAAGDKS